MAWLAADLSFVPKEKMVILCTHMPLRAGTAQNVQAVLDLLEGVAEVHVMTGHTHYAENLIYADRHPGIYEHVHGAVCGAWWHRRSTPTARRTDTPFTGSKGLRSPRGNTKARGSTSIARYGSTVPATSSWRGIRPITVSYTEDQIVANVWNADETWKIEVYENGVRQAK